MKPAILFTTETQRTQSNEPSAPATALASPVCGWNRVNKANPRQSVDKKFGSVLRALRAFVVSALVLTASLRAQTNTFPSSGNVRIGSTNPDNVLYVRG